MKQSHKVTTQYCMIVAQSAFGPEDMGALADRLEGNTWDQLMDWAKSRPEKPLLLIRLLSMIRQISLAHSHNPDFIMKQLAESCRKQMEHAEMVEAFDKEKGEAAYMNAWIKLFRKQLEPLNQKA